MISVSVNPGSKLVMEGTFVLVGTEEQLVMDRETFTIVEMAELMQRFRIDPEDPVLGRLKVTIEAAPPLTVVGG